MLFPGDPGVVFCGFGDDGASGSVPITSGTQLVDWPSGFVIVTDWAPVLAAVVANAARNRFGLWTILTLTAYAVGAAIPMLAIALGGFVLLLVASAALESLRFYSVRATLPDVHG